jgi:Family of unknown function (DUF6311)
MVDVAQRRCTAVIGGVLGFGWFYLIVGHAILGPTQLTWLMKGDGAIHLLGWLFFRQAPWLFPLGSVPNLSYPLGTTVGFTDSIPWVAVAAKAFSPVLPVDFQYVGLWLGLCYGLQGYFGVRIVQELSAQPFVQVLGGAFFILDPVLIRRLGHSSLAAHWLLLGVMWLHLHPCLDVRARRRMLQMAVGFCALSAGIHPYLAVMVLALSLALLWKWHWVDHWLMARQLLGWSGVLSIVELGILGLFGYLGSGASLGAQGFGQFAADVLTFVNAAGASHLLPILPYAPGQYEGFGYLGTGVLLLGLLGIALLWRSAKMPQGHSVKAMLPLVLCCAGFAVYALSAKIRIAGKLILDVGFLYQPFMPMIAAIRGSGRFIWPCHYLVIVGAIMLWTRYRQPSQRLLYAVFVATVLIQLADGHTPLMRWYFDDVQEPNPTLVEMDGWERAAEGYEHLALYPVPMIAAGWHGCAAQEYAMTDYVSVGYKAYRSSLTFNGGYVARIDTRRMQRYCAEFESEIQAGKLDDKTIYVVHPAHWERFRQYAPQATCGRLTSQIVCVSSQSHEAFRQVLERQRMH